MKGLAAGSVNLTLAFIMGATVPPLPNLAGALVVGFFAYGVSLVLFVVGLRHLGTARTGAYFSIAPFIGTELALAMGEPLTLTLVVAGSLMGLGIWLHLTERHNHTHMHQLFEHDHEHIHDEHHQHHHDILVELSTKYRHLHRHTPMTHFHPHFPDAHHQHMH